MLNSRLQHLCVGLAAASCTILAVALGADAASAADCTADNVFRMGITNTCNSNTSLSGSAFTQFIVSSSTPNGTGIAGLATATTGSGAGVEGETYSHDANTYGVFGFIGSAGSHSAGVYGLSSTTNGNGWGVFGESTSPNGSNGVQGISHASYASGVYGQNLDGGYGVAGRSNGNTSGGQNTGVYGEISQFSPLAGAAAIRGTNYGTNGNGYGVWGSQGGSGTGVLGQSSSGIGVLGYSDFVGLLGYAPAGGYAGYFAGDAVVSGTLYKGAGAFRIDHPLDPAHKYLQHSFVESPDMMDVYDGNVTTDSKGFATVKLPSYFQALNRSFRYQLTSLSGLQEVAVAKEIEHNRFTIQSQKPHSRVSWQVTGIRHDAYANAHRIQTVVEKPAAEQNKYLHPELYGKGKAFSAVPKVAAKALEQVKR